MLKSKIKDNRTANIIYCNKICGKDLPASIKWSYEVYLSNLNKNHYNFIKL